MKTARSPHPSGWGQAHFQLDLPCTQLRALLEKVIGNTVTYTKCTKREMMSVL